MKKVAVIGGGSWGIALASVISENVHNVTIYKRKFLESNDQEKLSSNVKISNKINHTLFKANAVIIAIPAQQIYKFFSKLKTIHKEFLTKIPIVIASKGIYNKGFMLLHNVIEEILGQCKVAVISGPNFASEVINKLYSGSTLAFLPSFIAEVENKQVIQNLTNIFTSKSFFVQVSSDLIGTEVCGAVKNVYAIGAGMLQAMDIGENIKAAYLSSSINEIKKIIKAYGGQEETVMTIAGIGDLILTCSSTKSRNTNFGYQFIKNKINIYNKESIEEMLLSYGVIEGLATLISIKQFTNHFNFSYSAIPICNALYRVIYENKNFQFDPEEELIRSIFTTFSR